MKLYHLILSAGALALAGCGTAYQAGQTPDAVYYSPGSGQSSYATNSNNDNSNVVAQDSDGGNYVVYQDGDNNYPDYDYKDGYGDGYSDGYYSRSINMFDRPGGLFSYNYYMMNSPWYGGSYWGYPYYNRFGWYNDPFMWSPGLSFSLGWGSPFGYSRWYNPYMPYYGYGHYGYGYGYYGGYNYLPGYYYGGYGKYVNFNPRPAVSYGPRYSAGSRAAVSGATRNTQNNVNAPRRVFTTQNSDGVVQPNDGTRGTRRVFKAESGERSISVDNNARTSERSEQPTRRIFRSRSDETPLNTSRQRTTTPTRTVSPRQNTRSERPVRRSSQPATRSYQPPSRSYSAPSNSSGSSTRSASPSRTSSPRRR